ncbi:MULTISPECIES: hypothetical protein [Streptomyces]|uniref:hypothetical protein n=1 Tax=Streptomyces TaxID=1883 RepID=UPI0004CD1874|nr:hypothetical protein [Streptomyces durhamensis]
MKKRSMLALASLATGFVVAAVTPSHGAGDRPVGDHKVADTVDSAGHPVGPPVAGDGHVVDDDALGRQ